jgi:glycosyltransferase involved in cell wall biosynthesis
VIASLASDAGSRRRLGEAARQRAAQYGWDRSVTAVVETYRRLLDGSHVVEEPTVAPERRGGP